MPEDIQERMRALIVQHGSVLAALVALQQTNFLENHVPHINVLAEFNQDTSEFAHECRNHLQRERRARQRTESAGPFEMPQERSNRLCQERGTVQQAIARAQPSFGNDALQLFGDEDALALA